MTLLDEFVILEESLQVDLAGFSPVTPYFDKSPKGQAPTSYVPDARTVISIAHKLNYTPIQNLPATRTSYMLEHDYANRHLGEAAHKVARFLEQRRFQAIAFDAGAGFYRQAGKTPESFAGDFSHKHAAVACGLGKFGLNNLVLTPQWGPRMRLATVITTAQLPQQQCDHPNPCPGEECLACVKVCPVHALDGWQGRYEPDTGWEMDKEKCYKYIFTTLRGQRCGLCIKACPIGLNGPPRIC